ncbi:MAG: single-stranded-DNA-specific exonuclease RecJ [Thermoguttaceae bacterium]|nr:single-stranded-DNA-specific exonuclease RecJ [Thermoguttaceae bacterium]MDW8038405.1 single-stranded-DNA-specific exonuclease RecJ [Thermoguttaceae bacterium]
MPKRWRIRPYDPEQLAWLERAVGIPPLIAQLLWVRGIREPASARCFLEPKLSALRGPEELPGCMEAADRLYEAVRQQRRIAIYGDYDVDGVTGTAILGRCLRLLGAEPIYYIPSRLEEGYGLREEAVRALAQRGVQVLITVDCGIGSIQEAEEASRLGIELLITDHHAPGAQLPKAAVIVHPRLGHPPYPFDSLSGSGVAMKLAWAVCQRAAGAKRVSSAMREFLLQAVGWAALGTVADVVPLVDENRILVSYGLVSLRERPSVGIAALLRRAGLAEKAALDGEDLAFQLVPRLNAAGRLGQASLALELLLTDQPERAETLAQYLDELNTTRKSLEHSIYLSALKQIKHHYPPSEHPAWVLADSQWHPGVIGIVASHLAEKFHRPVILIACDPTGQRPGIGSGRSIPGLPLPEALAACREHLLGFGGHAAAAGLRIRPEQIPAFREAFCQFVAHSLDPQQQGELWIDAEAPLAALTLRTVEQMERLAPFGYGNARPLLCSSGVLRQGDIRVMGAERRHLSMYLTQHGVRMRAVAFGASDWLDDLLEVQGPLDVAFRPVIQSFNGLRQVELHLVDWRRSEG